LEGEAQGLRARIRTEGDSPGLQERLSNLEAGVEDRELRIADYEQRHDYLREMAKNLVTREEPVAARDDRHEDRLRCSTPSHPRA
jgi:hypothetical protein